MSVSASTQGDDELEETPIGESQSEARAAAVEKLLCELRPLEHVPDDDVELYDARYALEGHVLDGRPIEVKSCLPWILDDGSPRRGRYWIRRGAHDQLVARDGLYVFVVVDPTSTLENPAVLDHTIVPANQALTEWLTWSPTGREHRAETCAQFSFAKLFPALEPPKQ